MAVVDRNRSYHWSKFLFSISIDKNGNTKEGLQRPSTKASEIESKGYTPY
jgi:hypothetical protein